MSHSTSVKPDGPSTVAVPLLLVFILWAVRALYFQEPWFALDDAYIYGHNAEVLLKGSDPNYGVSPLYGTTSAPFLLLLAGISMLLPMGWALEVANLVGALLYIGATWRLARGLSPAWPMVAVAVALLSAMTIHQLTNGLETGLAMAVVMWAIVGMVERSRWLGLLTGLLPFMRPDLAPLAGMIWLTSADKLRHAALAALTATPFALWFLIETGFPVSLTGYAKQLFFNEASWPLERRLKVSGAGLGLFFIHMGATAIGLVLLPRRLALCLVGGILPYLVIGMLRFPSSFVMYQMRYFYPFLPFAVAGLILHGRKKLLAAAATVGLLFLPYVVASDPHPLSRHHGRPLAPPPRLASRSPACRFESADPRCRPHSVAHGSAPHGCCRVEVTREYRRAKASPLHLARRLQSPSGHVILLSFPTEPR